MCGIRILIEDIKTNEASSFDDDHSKLLLMLERRGPHASKTVRMLPLCASSSAKRITLTSTVLHMRGEIMTQQPVEIVEDYDVYFCWNGEIYELLTADNDSELAEISEHESDTLVLSKLLREAIELKTESLLVTVASVLSKVVNAEFAFALVTPRFVLYGRDAWGRRSLLERVGDDNALLELSSVATSLVDSTDWQEITPGQVFQYDVATGERTSLSISCHEIPRIRLEDTPSVPSSDLQSLSVSIEMWQASMKLEYLLKQAVRRRLMCCRAREQQHHAAILFSGGLDSVVLAALAAQIVPELDLLNVAFGDDVGQSADRQAAIQSYREMKELFPSCCFRLVCVNVTWEQVQQHEAHVKQLIAPKTTLMDLNIGVALWFVSRGGGTLFSHGSEYTSRARILLVGMGADEQMAGYGRHRKAFQGAGNEKLRQELDLDMGRLWERNLGRDDRLLSDHGKEARFPFLDVHVVDFLKHLSLDHVCNLGLSPGVGDKQILRLVARRLGLATASGLVKRAIQFGSRISHVSDKQRFGSRRKAQGTLQC
jgi:asparagine synthetase B (glutamine-hydrolysing)